MKTLQFSNNDIDNINFIPYQFQYWFENGYWVKQVSVGCSSIHRDLIIKNMAVTLLRLMSARSGLESFKSKPSTLPSGYLSFVAG